MTRKKELLITLEFPPQIGGIATYLSELFKNFPLGSLKILALPDTAANYPHAVIRREFYFKRVWPQWLRAFFEAWKIISGEKIGRVYVSHVLPIGYIAFLLKKTRNIPYVVFFHGLDVKLAGRNRWKLFWLKLILKNAELVIANSNFTRRQVLGAIKPAACRIEVIQPSPKIFTIPQKNDKEKIIFSVARLVMRKGLDLGISAVAEIRKSMPSVQYYIAGDGPEKARLAAQIKSLGLEGSVHLLGAVPDATIAEYYSRASLFMFPVREISGDAEGFGIAPLEANAHGIPVLATRSGGIKEAIRDGETGILVPPGNVEALRETALFILRNVELGRKMGEAGRKWAENFKPEVQTKKLFSFLYGSDFNNNTGV